MPKLVFEDSGNEVEITENTEIQPVCEEEGIPFACTEGICGTCIVEITEGGENLSPYTQEEEDFLGNQDNERMACQCKILKGCVKIKY